MINPIYSQKKSYQKVFYFVALLLLFSFTADVKAQLYEVIPVTGFNQDVIAEGVGTGSNHQANATTTITFDSLNYSGASHVMYAKNFRGDKNPSTAPPYGLVDNGFIISSSNNNIRYQLANYTGNNALRLAGLNSTGTLTFATPGCYSALSILASSGQGASTFTVTLNFTDGTTNSSYSFTVADWYNGSNYAIQGIGRVNKTPDGSGETYDQFDGDATNPRLYDCTLTITGADLGKLLKSITITKNESGSGKTIILAVSGKINSNAPGTPYALSATNYNNTSFTANWNPVDNCTSYKLDVSTDANFSTFVTGYNNLDVGYVTTKNVTGLSAGIQYFYRVRAANANGQSFNSNVISIGGLTAPLASDATNKTSTSFSANWGSVGGTTSYKLDVATDFYFQSIVSGYSNLDVGNVTTYSVTGLTSGVTYYYRVRATNASNTSMSSNIVSTGLPVPPVTTFASNVLSTSFSANWAAVTATTYKLDVSTNSSFSSYVGSYNNYDMGNVVTFSVTGLTANTTYYYRVRSVNASGSSVNSNVVTVTTQAATTNINITSTGGTTSANYTTLKASFDAINAGTHTGTIVINVIGNTTESTSATLNASGSGSASYTSILIRPQGGTAKTISGTIAGSLVSLNGADYVTIDGLNAGGNTLKFENTSTSTSAVTIMMTNGATNNIIRNCTILGSTGQTTGSLNTYAVVTFSSGSNGSNTISYCNIGKSGSNYPWACIESGAGTNNSNTVTNCNLYDFKGQTGSNDYHSAIYLYYNTTSTWTITNNNIYQTATINSSGGKVSMIYIGGGDGYTITGNYIGGSAIQCGSTAMTYTGSVQYFYGIECSNNMATVNNNNISSNYFQNISYTTSNSTSCSNSSDPRFAFVHIWKGIFTVNSNTIGRTDINGSIYISQSSTAYSMYTMINLCYYTGVTLTSCNGNTIAGITIEATYYDAYLINGWYNAATTIGSISNNTIGSSFVSNSISVSLSTGSVTRNTLTLIYAGSAGISGVCNISNNNIQNVSRGTGGTSTFYVISSGYTSNITGNTIKNISSTTNATMYGISSSGASSNIYGNNITNLSNAADINGMYCSGNSISVYKNYLTGFSTSSTSNSVYGIQSQGSSGMNIYNNIISLGLDKDGNNIANNKFYGIYHNCGTSLYFNTIYICGTATTGTNSSYALYQISTSNASVIKNNILSNQRSNTSGTGKHYAIYLQSTPNVTIDYNDYYANGTGGVLGYLSGDKTTLANWKTATSQDANSLNTAPAYISTTGTYAGYLPTANLTGTAVTVTTDFEGKTRGSSPRMGALEGFIWKGTTSTDFNTASNWLCNQVPGTGSSVVFDAAPVNSCILDQNRTVACIINSQSTYIFDVNGKNLTITGDISLSNGAKIKADANGSSVIFAGTSQQNISSGAFGSYSVYNMTINNNSGVYSNCDFTISNCLTLTSGYISLGSSNLTLGASATIGGTPSGTAMIMPLGTGELRKVFTGTGSFTYPVGDIMDNDYTPITLNFTSGTFSSAYAGVTLTESKHPSNLSPTDYINRYWSVNQSGISSFSCDVTCQYVTRDVVGTETNLWTGKYDNGSGWIYLNQADAYNHRLTGTVTGFSQFTAGQQGIMPVKLQSFNTNVSKRDVTLNWITSSEINNKGFEIFRKNISGEWQSIGFMDGKGKENIITNYSFRDTKLSSGKYSYRLKQVDFNGNFEYFNLNGFIEVGIPDKFNLSQNYPNPFNPTTKIDFDLPCDCKVNINIYDLTGREIKKIMNENKTAGFYTIEFGMKDLASGVYFYKITAEGTSQKFTQTKKMVMIK